MKPDHQATHIFKIPQESSYSVWVGFFRMFLALFVLYVHIVPWAVAYDHPPLKIFQSIDRLIVKIFQSSLETNPAVLAFISLSGYCIHRNGLRSHQMNLPSFFLRRLFRIVPLLLFGTLLGVFVFSLMKQDIKIQAITGTYFLSWKGIIYKLSGLFSLVPFGFKSTYQGNSPLITCMVELWLYISYPFLGLYALKKGEKALAKVIIAITVVGVVLYTLFPALKPWWHNGSLFGFLIYWWLGVYAVHKSCKLFLFPKTTLCAYIFLTLFLMKFPHTFLLVEIRKILFCLITCMILREIDGKRGPLLLKHSFFESSFSLYALHTPLICLGLFYHWPLYLTVTLILLGAWATYVLIEKPFISKGRNYISQFNSDSQILRNIAT